MIKIFQHRTILKLLVLIVLALIFSAYLRPDMMVDVANTLLTLCGW